MTPTPQKSPSNLEEIGNLILVNEDGTNPIPFKDCWIFIHVKNAIESERTAYNALLDKVQLIETERDDLKKRVDSEYDRGIDEASKLFSSRKFLGPFTDDGIARAILKLRRVS